MLTWCYNYNYIHYRRSNTAVLAMDQFGSGHRILVADRIRIRTLRGGILLYTGLYYCQPGQVCVRLVQSGDGSLRWTSILWKNLWYPVIWRQSYQTFLSIKRTIFLIFAFKFDRFIVITLFSNVTEWERLTEKIRKWSFIGSTPAENFMNIYLRPVFPYIYFV